MGKRSAAAIAGVRNTPSDMHMEKEDDIARAKATRMPRAQEALGCRPGVGTKHIAGSNVGHGIRDAARTARGYPLGILGRSVSDYD